jgi:hypothetical protein
LVLVELELILLLVEMLEVIPYMDHLWLEVVAVLEQLQFLT